MRLPGQFTTGAVPSAMITIKEQLLERPAASCAVMVTEEFPLMVVP